MAFRVALAAGWVYTARHGSGAPPPPRGLRRHLTPICRPACNICKAGWFDRAEPLFRSALARHGERPDILHFLAVCLAQRGALGDAEGMWRKAIAKDPNEPMLSYNLGLVARRLGRLDEAARRFRDTIRRAPAHVEARLALASIHMDQGRFAAAERELGEFVGNVDQAMEQGGRAWQPEAAAGARRATCWATRSIAWAITGPRSRCWTWPWSMPATMPPAAARSWATARWRWAGSAITTRRSPRPSSALELAPESAVLQHVLGFVLNFAGRPAEAIGPDPARAGDRPRLHRRASGPWRLPRRRPAKAPRPSTCCSGRCARARPTATPSCSSPCCTSSRSSSPRPWPSLEPYLKQSPDDVRALNNQGLALRGLKRFEEARRALKRASRLSTDDPMVLTNLGCVLVDLGRAAEARSLHEHALRGLPGDSRLLGHYGICLAALGERDKARETLDAALAANPNNAEALRRP